MGSRPGRAPAKPPRLTYCLNVHPGETLEQVRCALLERAPAVFGRLAVPAEVARPAGGGLWLNAAVATELSRGEELRGLRESLDEQGIEVFTLNGFPMGPFGPTATGVKESVYEPDWSDAERLRHTERLARILAELLPPGGEGTISTLPVGYRRRVDAAGLEEAARNLAQAGAVLARLRRERGVTIRLALEPEPDCVLERAADVIDFFEGRLVEAAARRVAGPPALAEETLRRHVGVCLDTVHEAVVGEPPLESVGRYSGAGIGLFKVQLGAALLCRGLHSSRLSPFAEPTYLHQTRALLADGTTRAFADLPEALAAELPDDALLRVHFHVPLSWRGDGQLESSRDDVTRELLAAAVSAGARHLEVEVYTLEVLPGRARAAEELLAADLQILLDLL